jgi:hypothetical protein
MASYSKQRCVIIHLKFAVSNLQISLGFLWIFFWGFHNTTVEDGQKINKTFLGEYKNDNTRTTIPRYNFMFFHVFKMAVAIVFLCKNAVEAIQISSISMILSLNCSYSIFSKKTQ